MKEKQLKRKHEDRYEKENVIPLTVLLGTLFPYRHLTAFADRNWRIPAGTEMEPLSLAVTLIVRDSEDQPVLPDHERKNGCWKKSRIRRDL